MKIKQLQPALNCSRENNYLFVTITGTFVFVLSADLGCFLWIKQAAKLQCSKKVMYSHISARFVARTSGDHFALDIIV